jgi:protein TonB
MDKFFMGYLHKNFHLPQSAKNDKTTGRIIISFVVEKDGSLSAPEIVKGLSAELNAEAIRLIKEAPKWNPGMQGGRPVRVKFTIPIIVPSV